MITEHELEKGVVWLPGENFHFGKGFSLWHAAGAPRIRLASLRQFSYPKEGARKEQFMKASTFGKVFLAILTICLLVAVGTWAQTGTSSVVGTIIDPQGKPVPWAKVTLTNVATNDRRTAQSSGGGACSFDLMMPGDYRLEGGGEGFYKAVVGQGV